MFFFILLGVEFAYKLENGILNWTSFMHDPTHMQIARVPNRCTYTRVSDLSVS